jgi:Bacteriocin-protection, YdeI or OmpD-Associated/Domain of unknown function (DUF1905)
MVIFKTRLVGPVVQGEGPSIETTKDQSLALGEQEEIAVSGTINGVAFEGIFISNGDGTHYLNPDQKMLDEARLKEGDEFVVWAEVTPSTGPPEVPDDLRNALASDPVAYEAFAALPPRSKREHIEYVKGAKMSDTRTARITRTVERMKEKKP